MEGEHCSTQEEEEEEEEEDGEEEEEEEEEEEDGEEDVLQPMNELAPLTVLFPLACSLKIVILWSTG